MLNFGKAIEVLSRAQNDFPSDAQIRQRLAVAISNISCLYFYKGDPGRAESSVGRSLELLRQLHDEQPSNIAVKRDLARAIRNRGEFRLWFGSLQGAGDDLEEALDVIESLVARNPDVGDYRYLLGEARTYLGQVRAEQSRSLRAESCSERRSTANKSFSKQRPSMIQNTLTLIESRSILATVGRESGRLDDAKSSLGDALSSMKKHLEAHADATNRRIYFQVLLESTLLECSRGGATAGKLARSSRPCGTVKTRCENIRKIASSAAARLQVIWRSARSSRRWCDGYSLGKLQSSGRTDRTRSRDHARPSTAPLPQIPARIGARRCALQERKDRRSERGGEQGSGRRPEARGRGPILLL